MSLIPYLYSSFADYAFKGIPPVRAMNLEEGYRADAVLKEVSFDATANPYAMALKQEVKDQFMVSEYLLVAPLFEGEKERQVILPQGKWYDFYTGECVGEGEVITTSPGLNKIPVYVKDGAVIPLYPEIAKLDDTKYPLEIRHYGEKPGTYSLYDDDGGSYNYRKGEYMRIPLEVSVDASGKKEGKVETSDIERSWSFSDYRFVFY